MNTNKKSSAEIIDTVFKAVALAMGVATVVLTILGASSTGTLTFFLGIGLFCLAITSLDKKE
jgi:hypothetical protein